MQLFDLLDQLISFGPRLIQTGCELFPLGRPPPDAILNFDQPTMLDFYVLTRSAYVRVFGHMVLVYQFGPTGFTYPVLARTPFHHISPFPVATLVVRDSEITHGSCPWCTGNPLLDGNSPRLIYAFSDRDGFLPNWLRQPEATVCWSFWCVPASGLATL